MSLTDCGLECCARKHDNRSRGIFTAPLVEVAVLPPEYDYTY